MSTIYYRLMKKIKLQERTNDTLNNQGNATEKNYDSVRIKTAFTAYLSSIDRILRLNRR